MNPGDRADADLVTLPSAHGATETVERLKSFSVQTTSMGIPRNDTGTLTGRFRTRSWTASSTRSRAGLHRLTGVLSRRPRVSLTKSHCHPPTSSSTRTPLLGTR